MGVLAFVCAALCYQSKSIFSEMCACVCVWIYVWIYVCVCVCVCVRACVDIVRVRECACVVCVYHGLPMREHVTAVPQRVIAAGLSVIL